MAAGVHLRRSEDRSAEVEALEHSPGVRGRVGLAGVLADLDRTARVARVPGRATEWGFRWDDEDTRSRRWWPQGISTAADHDPSEEYVGRRVVLTSWYAKPVDGLDAGSRITVVDLTDPERIRYRHVLLVEPVTRDDGTVDVRPLKVHAGGIVWHRDHLYVAGTARGICAFRTDDVMRVQDREGFGYWLPLRFAYDGFAEHGHERMRYSFLSLGRGHDGVRLVAGEYGRRGRTTRLTDYGIDRRTGLLHTSEEGHAHPVTLSTKGLERMQGATVVGDQWFVTTSAGRCWRGSLHVGRPGAFRRHTRVLPVGVEDLAYWPSEDRLWSLSEYPGRRFVFTMPRPAA